MMLRICSAVGERAQISLVWMKALGNENAFHLQRLGAANMRLGKRGSFSVPVLEC